MKCGINSFIILNLTESAENSLISTCDFLEEGVDDALLRVFQYELEHTVSREVGLWVGVGGSILLLESSNATARF